MAGAIFGRTKNISISISALLVPLHDPLRIAEDIAVLDLISGGKLSVIGGLGYRPSEYAAHGKDWAGARGAHGRVHRHVLTGLDRRAVRVPGHDRAGHAPAVLPAPPAVPARRHVEGRRPDGRPGSACPSSSPPRCPRSRPTTTRSAPSTAPRASPWPRDRLPPHLPGRGRRQGLGGDGSSTSSTRPSTYSSWQTPDIKSAVHSHGQRRGRAPGRGHLPHPLAGRGRRGGQGRRRRRRHLHAPDLRRACPSRWAGASSTCCATRSCPPWADLNEGGEPTWPRPAERRSFPATAPSRCGSWPYPLRHRAGRCCGWRRWVCAAATSPSSTVST